MEQLRQVGVHPNIHAAMGRWLEAIRNVQARRRDEIINGANRQRSSTTRIQEDKGKRFKAHDIFTFFIGLTVTD